MTRIYSDLSYLADHLRRNKNINKDEINNISHHVAKINETQIPSYVQSLHVFGAWLSSLCLMFFFKIDDFFPPGIQGAIAAILFIAAANIIHYFSSKIFFKQWALVLSITGHFFLFLRLYNEESDLWLISFIGIILSSILYKTYQNSLHRFLSTLATLVSINCLILFEVESQLFFHGAILSEVVIFSWLILKQLSLPHLISFNHSLALIIMGSLLINEINYKDSLLKIHIDGTTFTWMGWLIFALLLASILKFYLFSSHHFNLKNKWAFSSFVVIVLTGYVATPVFLIGLCFLIIAFIHQDSRLKTLTILFLPYYMVLHYYNLDITLIEKSYYLILTGFLLLIIRKLISLIPSKVSS